MTSIFVSGLPKTATREQVSAFLRRTFADCSAVHVLRGATAQEHKGHAYVHFATSEAAQRAAQVASLQMDGHTLRARLTHAPDGARRDDIAVPRHAIDAYEDLPLPPQCIAYSFRRCAYCYLAALDATALQSDQITTTVVLSSANGPSCSTANEAQRGEGHGIQVVVFVSEAAREGAVRATGVFARCGAPVLEELLSLPGADRASCDRPFTRRRLEAVSTSNTAAQLARWQTEGLRPLTPSEALSAVAELLEGRGRVAVRDRAGGIAVLRVPTYVASIR